MDYYKILNVPQTAGDREIKIAFLKMAQKYHPDKNKGNRLAEKKFKQANLAYQTLRDPAKRKAFDEKPQKAKPPAGPKPAPRPAAPRAEKAIDLEESLTVTLESLCRPQTRRLAYLKPENGAKVKAHLDVPVPLGVKPGAKLRFKKLGGAGGTKLFGDLYVKIIPERHKIFEARKTDILLSLPVRFVDALSGKKIKIPSLHGAAALALPAVQSKAGLKDSQTFRLKGLGLPRSASGERGDMFVTILMDYPIGDKIKIQSMMKDMSLERKNYFIRKYGSESCLYPKVLEFQKKLREAQKAGG